MFIESAYGRRYVMGGLEAGPISLVSLLNGLTDAEADFQPDPERFTIREAIAHLADWEPIFLERMKRMVTEDNPKLPGHDEWEMAKELNYAGRDFRTELDRYVQGRKAVVSFLKGLSDGDWARTGVRDEIGPVTVEYIAILMSLHDSYHVRQVTEWRESYMLVDATG